MDYVTRQFINLAKKLRDEFRKARETLHDDLSRLADGLKNLKDAASTHWQANEKRYDANPVTVAELRTQIPIRVQTKAQRSKAETIWRVFKGALETVGIVAVCLYTVVAYQQWQEATDATNFVARQTELSRKGLNETTKNFRMDERSWIGIEGFSPSPLVPNQKFVASGKVTNSGKTPALDVKITTTTHFSDEPVNIAKYARSPERDKGKGKPRSVAVFFPGMVKYAIGGSDFPLPQTAIERITKTGGEGKFVYIFGEITYKDIFGEAHLTTFCFLYDPPNKDFDPCETYNYAN